MLFPLRDENPASRREYVTYGLIAVNVSVMLWLAMQPPQGQRIAVIRYGFIPARVAQLTDPKLLVDIPLGPLEPRVVNPRVVVNQPPAQFVELAPAPLQIVASAVTCMFLHGGWLHLAGNMWFLVVFGNNIEDRLGHGLYLLFYLVGGLLATSCHWAYDPRSVTPVIGASGTVAVILGAYAVTFPHAQIKSLLFLGIVLVFDIPAMVWLGLWLAGELVTAAFAGKDLTVAVWAHIGGFAAGAILMPILNFGDSPPGTSWSEEVRTHFPPER